MGNSPELIYLVLLCSNSWVQVCLYVCVCKTPLAFFICLLLPFKKSPVFHIFLQLEPVYLLRSQVVSLKTYCMSGLQVETQHFLRSSQYISGLQFRKQEHRKGPNFVISLFSLGTASPFDDASAISILKKGRKKKEKTSLELLNVFIMFCSLVALQK